MKLLFYDWSIIHSFTFEKKKLFTEHLLYSRHCAGWLGYKDRWAVTSALHLYRIYLHKKFHFCKMWLQEIPEQSVMYENEWGNWWRLCTGDNIWARFRSMSSSLLKGKGIKEKINANIYNVDSEYFILFCFVLRKRSWFRTTLWNVEWLIPSQEVQ